MSLNSDKKLPEGIDIVPVTKKRSRSPSHEKKSPASNLALAEIDSRLAQAIRDRAEALGKISELVHWQDRLGRLEQEINSLIGFQQRLSGSPMALTDSTRVLLPAEPSTFSHLNPIPDGVTSVPTRQPKPTTPNVAEKISGEGGFS